MFRECVQVLKCWANWLLGVTFKDILLLFHSFSFCFGKTHMRQWTYIAWWITFYKVVIKFCCWCYQSEMKEAKIKIKIKYKQSIIHIQKPFFIRCWFFSRKFLQLRKKKKIYKINSIPFQSFLMPPVDFYSVRDCKLIHESVETQKLTFIDIFVLNDESLCSRNQTQHQQKFNEL